MYNYNNETDQVLDILKQQEDYIIDQLNLLITAGVLKIYKTQTMLIQDPMSNKIKLQQGIRLGFEAEQRMQELINENTDLREKLEKIQSIL